MNVLYELTRTPAPLAVLTIGGLAMATAVIHQSLSMDLPAKSAPDYAAYCTRFASGDTVVGLISEPGKPQPPVYMPVLHDGQVSNLRMYYISDAKASGALAKVAGTPDSIGLNGSRVACKTATEEQEKGWAQVAPWLNLQGRKCEKPGGGRGCEPKLSYRGSGRREGNNTAYRGSGRREGNLGVGTSNFTISNLG